MTRVRRFSLKGLAVVSLAACHHDIVTMFHCRYTPCEHDVMRALVNECAVSRASPEFEGAVKVVHFLYSALLSEQPLSTGLPCCSGASSILHSDTMQAAVFPHSCSYLFACC